jgi:hypothetical protein
MVGNKLLGTQSQISSKLKKYLYIVFSCITIGALHIFLASNFEILGVIFESRK